MSTISPGEQPTAPLAVLAPDQLLAQNDIFSTAPGLRFRYLLGQPEQNIAHVVPLDGPTRWPQQWPLDKLVTAIKQRDYQKSLVQGLAAAYNDPSKTDAAHGARRYSYIKDLVATPEILFKKGRGKRIQEQARALGVSEQTVVAALHDYWRGGQTEDALLTRYEQGARKRAVALTQAQAPTEYPEASSNDTTGETKKPKSRGRKREDESDPYSLFGEERRRLQEVIVDNFLVKKTVTRHKLYRKVMTELYSYVDQDGKTKLVAAHRRPSRKQVSTLLDGALKLKDRTVHYSSAAEWENNSKPITGTVLQHSIGAGHVYEIDSTIVDLWLVARDNRNKIIGKATLYLVVDRYTRLIVGFHLTLDKPSWSGAMEALLSVVADKKTLCDRHGAEYRPEVWVAHGIVPYTVAADRGSEYLGHESDQIAGDIRINVVNMPAHMSCLKGVVECTFKLVHVPLKENSPGYEPPKNAFKRHGDKCYEQDAQFTLDELAAEFIDIIALHNLRMHPGMNLDPELVHEDVPPIPAVVWLKDVERRSGMLRTYDEAFMRHKLLPRKTAVVRQEGIYVNKCYYVCPEAFKDDWFVKAGQRRFPVRVTYDRRNVNQIYIHNPERGPQPYPAFLSPRSEDYRNYSVGEVIAVERKREAMRKLADEHNLQLGVAHAQGAAARAEAARRATAAAIEAADGASRKSGATEVRQGEMSMRNGEDTFPQVATSSTPNAPAPAPEASVSKPRATSPAGPSGGAAAVVRPIRKAASKATTKPATKTLGVPVTDASRQRLLDDFFNSADD